MLCLGADATTRYGEALHPGPQSYTQFHLGTANVAGALSKVQSVAELPFGYWGVTESHLTGTGIQSFRSSFRHSRAELHRPSKLAFGAPVPPRAADSIAGTWAGTLSACDFPIRSLHSPDDSVPYMTGRLHYAAFCVDQVQITGACVYGASQGPTYSDPLRITSEILDEVTQHLVRSNHGPRFVVGDFNAGLMDTFATQEWHDAGWRELQQFLAERYQRPIQPTCKKATTRDFVWLSPELLPYIIDGGILEDWFPDHDPVYALLQLPTNAQCISRWPMPSTLDWTQVQVPHWHEHCSQLPRFHWTTDMTGSFRKWSNRVETSLDGFYINEAGRPPRAALGRGQALRPRGGLAQQPHLKPARPGEERLQSDFVNRAVHRRYKQLRSLQALVHTLRNGLHTPNAQAHAGQLWSAITRSTGFNPSFHIDGGHIERSGDKAVLSTCLVSVQTMPFWKLSSSTTSSTFVPSRAGTFARRPRSCKQGENNLLKISSSR